MTYESIERSRSRKRFSERHWKAIALIVVGIALAVIAAVTVFIWFVDDAQTSGLVPTRLGGWSIGSCVTFFLHLAFWEIVLVGIPLIIAAAAMYFLWWNNLSNEDRGDYRRARFFERSNSTKGGSGFSFIVNLLFLAKVYTDHNWNTPFSSWSFDYLVGTYLWALAVILIIIGIPAIIGAVWWLSKHVGRAA